VLGVAATHSGGGSGSRSWNNSATSTPASPRIERQEGYFGPPSREGKIFSRQNSGNVPTLSTLRATTPTVDSKARGEDGEAASSSGTARGKGRDKSSHAA